MIKKKIVKKEIKVETPQETPVVPEKVIGEEQLKLELMIELMNHFGIAIEPKVYMKLEEEKNK